jgi:CubicO group peptidase (beta-lactamase class C family)
MTREARARLLQAAFLAGILTIGVSTTSGALPRPQPRANTAAALSTYWRTYLQRFLGRAPAGYGYAVYEHGQLVVSGAAGVSRRPTAGVAMLPMRVDTPVHLASISKTITAIALLHLLEERSIAPDAPMWPFLKDRFPGLIPGTGVDRITIAQLLAHKSGFDTVTLAEPVADGLRLQLSKPVPHATGQAFLYSNLNYSLARALIEAISGETYPAYVTRLVLRPAGVTGMFLKPDPARPLFVHRIGDMASSPFTDDFTAQAGAYGWYGTARDVAAIFSMLDGGGYLSATMKDRMFADQLGMFATPIENGIAYHHDGHWNRDDGRGSKTGAVIFPDHVVVALTMNTVWDGDLIKPLIEGYRQNVPQLIAVRPVKTPLPFIRVTQPRSATVVRCATDGHSPTRRSPAYLAPLAVPPSAIVSCAGFTAGVRTSHVTTIQLAG